MALAPNPYAPTMPHTPVKSGALLSIGYTPPVPHPTRPSPGILEVTFKADNRAYRWPGISPAEHQSLLASPSKGQALARLLKAHAK